jgi:predicted RNA-binding Zn ribbon-like protein
MVAPGWGRAERRDLLPPDCPHAAATILGAYGVLRDPACGAAWPAVADQVVAAAQTFHLYRAEETIRWEIDPAADLSAPLAAAAWSAGELLTSPALRRVRACAGAGCGWLFLDPTGRRRWCVMATCGNREKARRFAAKHKGPD